MNGNKPLSYRVRWEHENNIHLVVLSLDKEATIKEQDIIGVVGEEEEEIESRRTDKKRTIPIVAKTRTPVVNKKRKPCKTCGAGKLKQLILGGSKLLKAELGIDASSDDTMNTRKGFCESCEHYDFGVCGECGCFCAAKVKLKSEVCPIGKW